MSVQAAGIPRASEQVIKETVPIGSVLPVMAVAILCVWATHCSVTPPEPPPVHESVPEPAPALASAEEPPEVATSAPAPPEVAACAAEPPEGAASTPAPLEVAASAVEPPEVCSPHYSNDK